MNNLQKKFKKDVASEMKKKFGYKNIMAVPNLEKVSINVGISKAATNPDFADDVVNDIRQITGQAPIKTKARQAVAGFKIREGQTVGISVTLRGKRMWDFVERLISATIPRIRDFQGIERRNFDNQGNLNFPIKEQLVFPEISSDDVKTIFGLQVNVKNTAENKEEGIALLKLLGFPIKS
jgi:large subunit ribosomal protein L5